LPARLEKTKTPGVFKRGSRYVVIYRDLDGRQRQESARTYDQARRLRCSRVSDVDTGGYRPPSRVTLAEYARGWVERHQGSGRGFREATRADYRRDLERYVIPFLGHKRLTALRRPDVKALVAWLADDEAQAERHRRENMARERAGRRALRAPGPLRDGTVARIMAVLSGCLTAAVDDELRKDNPASRVVLPKRDALRDPGDDDAEDKAKALKRAELAVFLDLVRPDWRPFFRLLAATGLRVGEALALDERHLALDGSRPMVKVRRAVDKAGRTMDRPKSEHGARDVPLPHAVVVELRAHLARRPEPPADAQRRYGRLVFPSSSGTPMAQNNVRRRVLEPAAEEAGVAWVGFHAFRHTFASVHIERGTNIVRLSRLLGHHKPSFTLDVYGHLLDDGLGEPLDLDAELAGVARGVSESVSGVHVTPPQSAGVEVAYPA